MQKGGPDNRGEHFACSHRTKPAEQSLQEFRAMKNGEYKPKEVFLRMKMNLESGNPYMWDMAAYRITETHHHHRTADAWRIYPTYDFTHCLCDSFEEVSHSLCTTEFRTARESYDWLLQQLKEHLPAVPQQREFVPFGKSDIISGITNIILDTADLTSRELSYQNGKSPSWWRTRSSAVGTILAYIL